MSPSTQWHSTTGHKHHNGHKRHDGYKRHDGHDYHDGHKRHNSYKAHDGHQSHNGHELHYGHELHNGQNGLDRHDSHNDNGQDMNGHGSITKLLAIQGFQRSAHLHLKVKILGCKIRAERLYSCRNKTHYIRLVFIRLVYFFRIYPILKIWPKNS